MTLRFRDLRLSLPLCLAAALAPLAGLAQIPAQIEGGAASTGAAGEAYRSASGDKSSLIFVPIPIVDPTLGNGLALAGLYTFATSDDPTSPRSTIAAAAGYTDTETWAAGAGMNLHLSDDRYRLALMGGLGEFNLKYYGIGGDSVFAHNPVGFSATGYFGQASAKTRVAGSTYVGLNARYLDTEVGTKVPIDALPELTVPFQMLGVGPVLEYDSRDNSWWPTHGLLGTADFTWYLDATNVLSFDVTGDFTTANLSLAGYWPLAENLVLAGQAGVSTAGDDAPFFMNPFVSIRGFPAGRYLDAAVAQAQAELRWYAWKGLGFVAFGGVGVTGPGIGEFENSAIGYGAGVRYRVSEADRMNVGMDLATGDGELALYFRIGEAF